MSVLVQTTLGDFTIDLNVKRAPQASLNFIKLCKVYVLPHPFIKKLKHYNYSQFSRIQSGLSAELTPTSPPSSIWAKTSPPSGDVLFKPEKHDKLLHKKRGTVSWSCTPGGLAASSFFITLNDPHDRHLDYLDSVHAPFGIIVEDESDVLAKLDTSPVDARKVPVCFSLCTNTIKFLDIRVLHTIVLDDPFDDLKGMRIPTRSPSPSIDVISSMRLNNAEASAEAVPEHELAALEKRNVANANALTLELVGDLPFAEVKPPENVLFVAKLNPVTTEPDLSMIFSRFGVCVVKLVKDGESGKSLGYAFIGISLPSIYISRV